MRHVCVFTSEDKTRSHVGVYRGVVHGGGEKEEGQDGERCVRRGSISSDRVREKVWCKGRRGKGEGKELTDHPVSSSVKRTTSGVGRGRKTPVRFTTRTTNYDHDGTRRRGRYYLLERYPNR